MTKDKQNLTAQFMRGIRYLFNPAKDDTPSDIMEDNKRRTLAARGSIGSG